MVSGDQIQMCHPHCPAATALAPLSPCAFLSSTAVSPVLPRTGACLVQGSVLSTGAPGLVRWGTWP